jgi:hypothetical protein
MPQSDLKELREFVANVLDYNPSNPNYARQVDDLLNQADRMVCQEKPFTFINKVVDVPVFKDVSFPATGATALTFTNATQVVTAAGASFLSWMAGQEIEVTQAGGTKETFIINNVVSSTDIRIDRDWLGTTGTYEAVIINRYIDLPQDCTTVLGVARRSQARTPNDPGLLENLARYEDEWWNLPLGEVNLPIYWIFYDPFHLRGPRRNLSLSTAVAAGRGARTIEFTSTLVFAGRESPHGEIVSISATDAQDIVLTPFAQTTNSGLYKRYYWRSTQYGYNAWRILDDPLNAGKVMELTPTDVAARTYSLSVTTLTTTEALYDDARLLNPDGFKQRIRLYPRQDKDYIFQVRYMVRHQTMQENNDVSLIPPAHRMIIAYKALADVLVKHDNASQAEMYRKRFEQELLQLEKRYLISPSKRLVKGNWLTNMEPNSFNRYTTLVHT